LKETIKAINELKREGVIKEYAIGGAVAALFYTEPVMTQDLDVFVLFPAPEKSKLITLKPIYDALRSRGYREQREFVEIEGYLVQFLPATGALLEEAIREAYDKQYEGTTVRVMRPEHLVAIALQTGRLKDKVRVSLLLEQAKMDGDYLNTILERYKLKNKFRQWIG
jgi:hypothetical protein